ncbi:MAG: DNA mismatch endonuclease Vsr [SAR202 cluster bacterium]|nr:very short patch repair endonuclease [Chloroflexota bacterium]MDP6420825.1 very short patch repair endonuclease [SAR202 cluster bacterium]HAL48777.1 very short patch repair endonuclease [Dehalococcoidia bacterium]MDP6662441.1 very short patch repair endonuclease [SAR202 cluster bacterium]MDP6799770.1 very short patch repair endonuclease [SAR202 cluster bacterium]
MPDQFTPEARSRIMASVHSENTSSEIAVRKALHAAGFRFRLHRKDLPGKPDIVLPRLSTIVLVNGCLWHGHQCSRFRWPVANADYWRAKIQRNMDRDESNLRSLESLGWKVLTVWDCELKSGISEVLDTLHSS